MTDSLEKLSNKIGYQFVNESLLATAMRHSSWTAENDGFESNERLEFLGDSVIGFVIADVMFRRYPEFNEGKLTDLRKIVVNMTSLSRVATQLGLGEFVLLGRGEAAGVYEIVEVLLVELIDEALGALKQLDAKSQLQELAARSSLPVPEYRVTDEGPDHAKMFFAAVYIGDDWMGAGSGRSKKVAEENAAQQAFKTLQSS
jgi:ribonuclease III